MNWELRNEKAIVGADLCTTMWGTISGVLRRMAAVMRKDVNKGGGKYERSTKGLIRDSGFFHYLTCSDSSPLRRAMDKAELSHEEETEWIRRLW